MKKGLGFILALLATAQTWGAYSSYVAVGHTHRLIYHSPQSPGFTSWVGAWIMPDRSIMISFTQATGPLQGRPSAPETIRRRMSWPPPGHPAGYDMTGLDMANVHLRSDDRGATWRKVSADPFTSCMNGTAGQAEIALRDGTILRGVWGQYLVYDPDVPRSAFLQRSHDGSVTWGKPEVLIDAAKAVIWTKRIRMLRDGRLIVLGGIVHGAWADRTRDELGTSIEPLLLVSADQGKTWKGPIPVVPPEHRKNWGGEEFDAAEMANGDLLCVFRRINPEGKSARWQGLLRKTGDSWTTTTARPAPLQHSGQPELLATKEGPILHIATTGVHLTDDGGENWRQLQIPGSAYYPRSVQTEDGRIFVFGHVGSDNAYGAVDQSIVMDSFVLAKP